MILRFENYHIFNICLFRSWSVPADTVQKARQCAILAHSFGNAVLASDENERPHDDPSS